MLCQAKCFEEIPNLPICMPMISRVSAAHLHLQPARACGWLDERLGLSALREFAAHKTVPLHSATIWYYFGGITLFLFTIQVLTGVLLLLYSRPSPTEAYESVQFIMTRVQFGWLVRSIHSWSANLMILTAFIRSEGRRVGKQ